MALLETLTVGVGAAVAKTALKRWLEDAEFAKDASASVVDILAKKVPDTIAQRRTARSLERVAEDVAEALAPFFETEAGGLPENEQKATAIAVADSLASAQFVGGDLFANDLDPQALEQLVRRAVPDAARDLSDAATSLYDKALRESCTYVIEITSTLPGFALQSAQEMLKREGEIERLVKKVFEELPKLQRGDGAQDADLAFLNEYRRAVSRKLDRLELFGITTTGTSRRYSLSVAYITLTAVKPTEPPDPQEQDDDDPTDDIDYLPVDEALAPNRRVLVRAEAGSGKTTLLQWLAVQAARDRFEASLESWNGQVPFFLQLRRWVNVDLPRPEAFLDYVSPNIVDAMPKQWVHWTCIEKVESTN